MNKEMVYDLSTFIVSGKDGCENASHSSDMSMGDEEVVLDENFDDLFMLSLFH